VRQFLVLLAATLVRGGADLLLVAELLGHARLETTRGATWLTAADRVKTLGFLPVDRRPPAAHPATASFTRILAVPHHGPQRAWSVPYASLVNGHPCMQEKCRCLLTESPVNASGCLLH
jgi:integrase/recombinase XerC